MLVVITFLLVLGLLIATHELGHFLAAKFFKVKVDEFAIGFPPQVWSKKIGETTYALNIVPFGGYVKVCGEDDSVVVSAADQARALVNQPKWVQAVILVAGVMGNLLLAWLFFSIAFVVGFPLSGEALNRYPTASSHTIITSVVPNSAAAEAGFLVGDQVVQANVKGVASRPQSVEDLRTLITESDGHPIVFSLERGNEAVTLSVVPKVEAGQSYLLGLAVAKIGVVSLPLWQALPEGLRVTFLTIKETFFGFGYLISEISRGHSVKDAVAGPIGIANLVGEAQSLGIVYLLTFIAFISVNLAVLNILPIPALDGGRLLFLLIEKLLGRPIKKDLASKINLTSFLLLIVLMLVITGLDIWRLVK